MGKIFVAFGILIYCYLSSITLPVICERLTENTFKNIETASHSEHANFSDIRRSTLDCAASCDKHPGCLTFTFDKLSKLCVKSSGLVNDIGSKVYRNGGIDLSEISKTATTTDAKTPTTWETTAATESTAPTDETTAPTTDFTASAKTTTIDRADLCTAGGYTYYPERNLCIKLYRTEAFQVNNKAKCEDDGAHLLLIKDATMHSFIKQELTNWDSGDVFIDGEDPELDGNFVTWNDKSLPYLKWKSGDPDKEPCMRLDASDKFDFGDELCSKLYKHGCVCEKDIPL